MSRRARAVGIAILGAAAVTAVVVLVLLRIVGPVGWPDDAIFVPRDAATIQDAADRAASGGTIVLQASHGPFSGPVTISASGLTVTSDRGRATLESGGAAPALAILGDDVAVRGIEIISESVGVRIESARCSVEDLRIGDSPIGIQLAGAREGTLDGIEVDGAQIGLELVSAGGNHLSNIEVRRATEVGIKLLGSWGNTLEAVEIGDAPVGVALEQGSSENALHACRIERASIVGVEIRGSNDNVLEDSEIRDIQMGVVLEGVTGNEIRRCDIEDAVAAGLSLQQAVQNRASENSVRASQDAGILLSQSAENALSYNRIDGCGGAGIRLDGSDRNLMIGNRLERNGVGLDLRRCRDDRILRNVIADGVEAGIRIEGSGDNSLFDNQLSGGAFGVVVSMSADNVLLRNRIEGMETAALCLLDGSTGNTVAENWLTENPIGLLMVDSPRADVLDNLISKNDTGVLLAGAGSGIRIEGNTILRNGIGLRQSDGVEPGAFGGLTEGAGEVAAPVLANNVFDDNATFDVANETAIALYAGGNWWGSAREVRDPTKAAVSDGVHLVGSAWKGTVAIGTEADLAHEILGRIVQLALRDAGYRVIDLIGMGGSDRVREALRARDVDFVWWGTEETVLPDGGADDLDVSTIPAGRRWLVIVSEAVADRLPEPTLSALATTLEESGETIRYAVPRRLGEAGFLSYEEIYGLRTSTGSINWADALAETETLLKFGAVDAVITDSLEETLTLSGFVALEDDLGAFGTVGIFLASRPGLVQDHPEIEALLDVLGAALTDVVLHDLISRVRLLQRQPEEVAYEELVQQGVLAE